MATLAFSRLGWTALALSFATSDADIAVRNTYLLAESDAAYPRLVLPHRLSDKIVAERARIDLAERAIEAWAVGR